LDDIRLRIFEMIEEAEGLQPEEPVGDAPPGSFRLGVLPSGLRKMEALYQHARLLVEITTDSLATAEEEGAEGSLQELAKKTKSLEAERDYIQTVYQFEAARYFHVEGSRPRLWLCKGWEVYATPAETEQAIYMAGGFALGIMIERMFSRHDQHS